MRKIKFRGKSIKTDEWHYGSLLTNNTDWACITDTLPNNEVNPDTVSQFTGVCDCDGKEIYEGDIFTVTHGYPKNITFVVKYYGTAFLATPSNVNYRSYTVDHFKNYCKVVGNVYDNPELLNAMQESA